MFLRGLLIRAEKNNRDTVVLRDTVFIFSRMPSIRRSTIHSA